MDRRKVLLVLATIIAALGTMLVFLYVRSADQRADQKFDAIPVLRAVQQINQGETIAAAQAAGKIEVGSVARDQRLPDALDDLGSVEDQTAQTPIYPGEQIIASKFATEAPSGSGLDIPKGKLAISVNLTDTARVAGFVNPGDQVSVFATGSFGEDGSSTRLLLPKVQVIAVGTTPTVVPTTTTDSTGAETTEQLPRTLLTLAVDQSDAQRVIYAASNSDLAFGLLTKDSKVSPDGGANAENLFK